MVIETRQSRIQLLCKQLGTDKASKHVLI